MVLAFAAAGLPVAAAAGLTAQGAQLALLLPSNAVMENEMAWSVCRWCYVAVGVNIFAILLFNLAIVLCNQFLPREAVFHLSPFRS